MNAAGKDANNSLADLTLERKYSLGTRIKGEKYACKND